MADISAGVAVRTLGTSDLGLGQEAQEAHAAAAARFAARTVERTEKIERLNAGATAADTPERMAKRGDRLRRYHAGEQLRSAPVAVPAHPMAVNSPVVMSMVPIVPASAANRTPVPGCWAMASMLKVPVPVPTFVSFVSTLASLRNTRDSWSWASPSVASGVPSARL